MVLLLLLLALLPLGSFLAGFLPGGKGRAEPEPAAAARRDAGTLEVTVLRQGDLTPVEGARILVESLTGGAAERQSDLQGRVRLRGLGAGPVRVAATVDGRTTEAWVDPATQQEVLLSVGPEPVRTGRVTRADGTPARAHVRLLASDARELASTTTDERGCYELPDQREAASVCAVAQGTAPAAAPRGDVVLHEGTLVDGQLNGAGEGTLTVYGRVAAPQADDLIPFRVEWPVDANGAFRGRLPSGVEAFGTYEGLPVRVEAGPRDLPSSIRCSGVVRRSDGVPAARAVLLFRPLLDADFPPPLPGLRLEADAEGAFAAAGFADVRYSVEVYAPGCETRVVDDVRPGQGPIDLTLEPGYAVAGFVLDTAGLPVPGACVRAVGLPDENGRPVLTAEADAQGRFRVAGLGGTHARIRITAEGYHSTTLDHVTPKSNLRIVLQQANR